MARDLVTSGRAAALAGITRGRSRLYRWLWERYGELEAARQSAGQMNWTGVAEVANGEGVRTKDKRPISGHHVRETFLRVDRDARAVGHQQAAESAPLSEAHPPPSAPAAPTPGRRNTFKTSSLRYSKPGDTDYCLLRSRQRQPRHSPRSSHLGVHSDDHSSQSPYLFPPSVQRHRRIHIKRLWTCPAARRRWFLGGRGNTGKTTLARWLAGLAAQNDATVSVAACDPGNRSLKRFINDVAEPSSNDATETRDWLLDYLNWANENKTNGDHRPRGRADSAA